MAVTWPEGDVLGRTAAAWESLLTRGVNVCEFGAVGDARVVTDAAINTGTNVLTSATANFTSADVGKTVSVRFAGAIIASFFTAGSSLVTTIASVSNSTTAILAANAGNTAIATGCTIGTRNNTPVTSASTYAGEDTLYFPPGTYMIVGQYNFAVANQTIHLERGAKLLYDGSSFIGRAFALTANGISIVGEGIIDGNDACTSASNRGAGASVLNVGGRSDSLVEGITIQNGSLFGIGSNDAVRSTVRNVKFFNLQTAYTNQNTADSLCYDLVVEGCYIDNSNCGVLQGTATWLGSGMGVGGGVVHLPTRVRMTNNTVICPPASLGSLMSANTGCIGGAAIDWVIEGNICIGGRISISPEFSFNTTVSNNVIHGPLDWGIEIPGMVNASVTGNTVDGDGITASGGIVVDAAGLLASNITISGNNVRDIAIGTNCISVQNLNKNVNIVGNYVEVPDGGGGIVLNGSPGSIIANNRIQNTAGATPSSGVFITSGSTTIMGNLIDTGFTNPIEIFAAAPLTLSRLIIIGNNSDAVLTVVKNANVTLGTNCKVHSNGGDAALTTI